MILKQYSSVVKKNPIIGFCAHKTHFTPSKCLESQKKKKRIERTWRKKESLMATIKKWQYRDNIKSQVEDTNNSMAKNEKTKK